MKALKTDTALTLIAILLVGNLAMNVAQNWIQPAMAGSTIDCRIVDINTYDKLPVKIADIDTNDALNVKAVSTYNALKVNVVEWEERDAVSVKIAP